MDCNAIQAYEAGQGYTCKACAAQISTVDQSQSQNTEIESQPLQMTAHSQLQLSFHQPQYVDLPPRKPIDYEQGFVPVSLGS